MNHPQQNLPEPAIRTLFCILIVFFLVAPLSARSDQLQRSRSEESTNPDSTEWLGPGIVVETVKKEGYGAKAGLKAGDVLLSWSDGKKKNKLTMPLDFQRIETEQNRTLRKSIFHGSRSGKNLSWTLTPGVWRVETRPNLLNDPLNLYLGAEEQESTGHPSKATEQFLALARNDGIQVPWLRAWLISRAAKALSQAKAPEEADAAYRAAIDELGPSEAGGVFWLWEKAHLNFAEGKIQAAKSDYEEATARLKAAGAGMSPMAADNAAFKFAIAIQEGDLATADQYAKEEQRILERIEHGDRLYLSALGVVSFQLGDTIKAEGYFRELLAESDHSKSHSDRHYALGGLSMVAYGRGNLEEAIRYAKMSLAIAKKESYGSSVGGTYEVLGMYVREKGDFATAEKYFRLALANALAWQVPGYMVANDYDHLGVLYELEGKLDKAAFYFRKAIKICSAKWPDSLELAWSHSDLADTLQKLGDLDEAEHHYRLAATSMRKTMPGTRYLAETLGSLANVLRRKGRWEDAAAFYDETLQVLENNTARLGGSGDTRAAFRAKHARYYTEYIDLLVGQNQTEHALDILERSRARTLIETLAAANVNIHAGAEPALLVQERSLQAQIRAKSGRRISLISGSHNDEQIKSIEKEISDLTTAYQEVEGQIRSRSPDYAALTQPQPLTAREIQEQLLTPDTLLLEYSLGEERSFVFALTSDSLQAYPLPPRAQIEDAARQAYKLLTASNRHSRAAARSPLPSERVLSAALNKLSSMILAPIARQMPGKRLLIVPDGALQYIPFQAIPEPALAPSLAPVNPMVAAHEVFNLPSASVLALLRQQRMNRPAAPKAVAVLADPVFAKDDSRLMHRTPAPTTDLAATSREAVLGASFSTGLLTRSAAEVGLTRGNRVALPRLPFSRREADAILSVTPPGLGLEALDFRASRTTAMSPELGQYRIIHFATHGLLNSEHPELSGLVFSLVNAKGRPQEGFLELQDIYNLKLQADLVVLSACETGLGKEISGEGLIGLTRGFMYAGANRVVASLWNVSDAATAQLMAEFYRAMEKDGMAPAAALRQAQIAMWKQKRWRSPYFWAAFQLQGEWN